MLVESWDAALQPKPSRASSAWSPSISSSWAEPLVEQMGSSWGGPCSLLPASLPPLASALLPLGRVGGVRCLGPA